MENSKNPKFPAAENSGKKPQRKRRDDGKLSPGIRNPAFAALLSELRGGEVDGLGNKSSEGFKLVIEHGEFDEKLIKAIQRLGVGFVVVKQGELFEKNS